MNEYENQKQQKKKLGKQTRPIRPDGGSVSLGGEDLPTFDDIEQELDELLSRAKARGYELAKKYRQKSGQ